MNRQSFISSTPSIAYMSGTIIDKGGKRSIDREVAEMRARHSRAEADKDKVTDGAASASD